MNHKICLSLSRSAVHCLVSRGSRGDQLQLLVLHRPDGLPLPHDTINCFWMLLDILSDIVNVIDILIWQPRLQFVNAGDIIVSPEAL